MKKAIYIEILKEINEWEETCCENRGETIEELSETVYPEIISFMKEDGYMESEILHVMNHRNGEDIKEFEKIV